MKTSPVLVVAILVIIAMLAVVIHILLQSGSKAEMESSATLTIVGSAIAAKITEAFRALVPVVKPNLLCIHGARTSTAKKP